MLSRLQEATSRILDGGIPAPAARDVFVGDGDYRSIAAEFLGYFVEVAGLRPTESVLDVGCGIGRMAAALSAFLDPGAGRYAGFDPVARGIAWCRDAYGEDYPHFRFEHVDVANALYNPDGRVPEAEVVFPAADASVDLAVLTSVFTHMDAPAIGHYFGELARVLAPGGRVFATAFLFEPPTPPPNPAIDHLNFTVRSPDHPGQWHAEDLPPLAAVAFEEGGFADLARRRLGLPVRVHPGRWRGGAGPWFQDLVLAGAIAGDKEGTGPAGQGDG